MADRAGRRGNRDGINRAILEAGVGSTRTVLETELPKARRSELDVGNVTSSASAIESRTAGTKEGFRGRGAVGEATGGKRADPELCPRCRATALAGGHTAKVPADTRPGAATEPAREPVGGVSN